MNPTGYRVAAFWVTASNVTFKGFDVINVKENITTSNNQSIGFAIYGGTSCTLNNVAVHDGECVGFYLEGASASNTFLNCDAYNLTGINSYSYGNADGFGCHPNASGTGNVYNACRSWNNSDDGYDCLNAAAPVTFEYLLVLPERQQRWKWQRLQSRGLGLDAAEPDSQSPACTHR
ncbi:MAG: hypothetical protein QM796_16000 [Chthoniobacteraceae bacterium]